MRRKRERRPRQHSKITVVSPFPAPSYFDLFEWEQAIWDVVSDDFSVNDRDQFIENHIAKAELETVKTWGVWRDDHELGGYVCAEVFPQRPWIAVVHCLFKRSFFGSHITVPAVHQVLSEIFETGGVIKIETWVFTYNDAVKSLIRAIGGTREGILTAQTLKHGSPVDVEVYGLYPRDMTELKDISRGRKPIAEKEKQWDLNP